MQVQTQVQPENIQSPEIWVDDQLPEFFDESYGFLPFSAQAEAWQKRVNNAEEITNDEGKNHSGSFENSGSCDNKQSDITENLGEKSKPVSKSAKKSKKQEKEEKKEKVRLGNRYHEVNWGDNIAKYRAGITEDGDIGAILFDDTSESKKTRNLIRKTARVIQNYLAELGWGERRKREGVAGELSEKIVKGYEIGFGSLALCHNIPIPSQGINKERMKYETGSSGMMEVMYDGIAENVREAITLHEFMDSAEANEEGHIAKKSVVQCKSWKCLECTIAKTIELCSQLKWALMCTLFHGNSYAFGTITLRHFFRDFRRQKDALCKIFREFDSDNIVKKLKRKYGFNIFFRMMENTMDSLYAKKKTGAHPHFHMVLEFRRKVGNKNGTITEYPVPTEDDMAEIQKKMAEAWFKHNKKYYDKIEPGMADKHKNNILRHGIKLQLYAYESKRPKGLQGEEKDKWDAGKEKFDKHVQKIKKEWEESSLKLPEDIKRNVPGINRIWAGYEEHFYKQLAGLSDVASYTGLVSSYQICKEITAGLLKNGRMDDRVHYFTWFHQGANFHNKNVDAIVKDFVKSMFHTRFVNKSRTYKNYVKNEVFMLYEDGKPCDPILTCDEAYENVASAKIVPKILPGDRILLDSFGFGSHDFKNIHKRCSDDLIVKINSEISYLTKCDLTKNVDVKDSRYGRDLAKAIYDKHIKGILGCKGELADGLCKKHAGRGSPIIPEYLYDSHCWTPHRDKLKQQRYRYQEILRLCKRVRPAEFLKICRDIIGNPNFDGVCGLTLAESIENLLKFECYSRFAEVYVEAVWRGDEDNSLKKRINESHEKWRICYYPVYRECIRDQKAEERGAIRQVLRNIGFDEDYVRDYAKNATYESLIYDLFGHCEVMKVVHSSRVICRDNHIKSVLVTGNHYTIDKKKCFNFAPMYYGLNWRPFDPCFSENVLAGIEGWWGEGLNTEIFDLSFADKVCTKLKRSFKFGDYWRDELVHRKPGSYEVVGYGGGDLSGYVLVYFKGRLWNDLQRIKTQQLVDDSKYAFKLECVD